MQFVANLQFRGDDAECERLYNECKKARGKLQRYLFEEGIDFYLLLKSKENEKTAANNCRH